MLPLARPMTFYIVRLAESKKGVNNFIRVGSSLLSHLDSQIASLIPSTCLENLSRVAGKTFALNDVVSPIA